MGIYTPPALPGLIQIGPTQTITSTVTSVNFVGGITADYDEYQVHFRGVVPMLTNELFLRTSTNGGASYSFTAGDYSWNAIAGQASVGLNAINAGNLAGVAIPISCGAPVINVAAMGGASGVVRIYRPADATAYKSVLYEAVVPVDAVNDFVIGTGGGIRLSTAPVNAIRILSAGGGLAAGIFALYGVKK